MEQRPKRFYLSESDKKLAGVAGGIGEYFNIDPTFVRVGFVVFTLISGIGLLAYVILALIAPTRSAEETNERMREDIRNRSKPGEPYDPFGHNEEVEEEFEEEPIYEEEDFVDLEYERALADEEVKDEDDTIHLEHEEVLYEEIEEESNEGQSEK